MACPVPHKPRDQVWLTVGLAAGCMIGYYYGSRKRSTTSTIGTRPKQTIGFIGCGTISSAIVTGLCTLLPADRPSKIVLSPRNSEKAAALASQFPNIVTVASTNQEVVNLSDVVFLAVIPQIAKKVLSTLTFQKKHTIISVISALSINDLVPLVQPVPSTQICRAIPLPAVAVHKGSTIVTSHPDAERIFNLLGTAVIARNSKEFENSLIRSVRGRYTNYIICVVAGHKTWHIGHRYSEFEQLHMNLRMHLGKSILPPFPPK